MKNAWLALALILLGSVSFAQEENSLYAPEEEVPRDSLFLSPDRMKLAIIPFEPKMYRSEIDRFVGEHDGLTFQQVRGYFRLGLDNALFIEANKDYDVVRMHADDPEINRDLDYVYKSIGYQYRVMPKPKEPEVKGLAKIRKDIKDGVQGAIDDYNNKTDPPLPKSAIENGQVVHIGYSQERFMATTLINPEMFNYLGEKYEAGLYLFINQLDIRNSPGQDYRDYGTGNFTRTIKIHYTIMTEDKKEVYAGAVKREFSGRTNSIKKIIVQNFPPMAEMIIKSLPVMVNTDLAPEQID